MLSVNGGRYGRYFFSTLRLDDTKFTRPQIITVLIRNQMKISLKTVMDNLPPEQRARVKKRTAELIAKEIALQDLCKLEEFKDQPAVEISGLISTIAESRDREEL